MEQDNSHLLSRQSAFFDEEYEAMHLKALVETEGYLILDRMVQRRIDLCRGRLETVPSHDPAELVRLQTTIKVLNQLRTEILAKARITV